MGKDGISMFMVAYDGKSSIGKDYLNVLGITFWCLTSY
jgi:hypothetical protein